MESPNHEDRLRLLRFVCSFAWADLDVNTSERDYVHQLTERLHLTEDEKVLVEAWLVVPPPAEDIDPFDIPEEQRQAVLEAAAALIRADGQVAQAELENFMLLEALIGALEMTEMTEELPK
ncbi:MAG: TerB family tellurite resistance protein [Deltaproteobacteria bacterium]|nr:TerB family tellurite resistance protein [Deltaproteobacteria bacterium]